MTDCSSVRLVQESKYAKEMPYAFQSETNKPRRVVEKFSMMALIEALDAKILFVASNPSG